jgi:hypothetical protein
MVLGNKGSKRDARERASEDAREYDRADCDGTHVNAGIQSSGARWEKMHADRRMTVIPPDLQIVFGPTSATVRPEESLPKPEPLFQLLLSCLP